MKFIGTLVAIAAAVAVFFAVVGTPALYVGAAVVVLLGLGLTVPSPFRENLRLGSAFVSATPSTVWLPTPSAPKPASPSSPTKSRKTSARSPTCVAP